MESGKRVRVKILEAATHLVTLIYGKESMLALTRLIMQSIQHTSLITSGEILILSHD